MRRENRKPRTREMRQQRAWRITQKRDAVGDDFKHVPSSDESNGDVVLKLLFRRFVKFCCNAESFISSSPLSFSLEIKSEKVVRVPAISLKMSDIPPDDFSWRKYGQKPIKDLLIQGATTNAVA
ncbi:hypothetical protein GIB67_041750 [Kingdonia uniflora]|uniref:WRKY domain-containing protein n=1 Tax=Kingdonia uniflora TaxID=39325 RepID=A0A7J7MI56_9MAGN|nr:hypothetical protein GIB67_041750 [Kingdonia uniflora]